MTLEERTCVECREIKLCDAAEQGWPVLEESE
jgi:hypothetical protein